MSAKRNIEVFSAGGSMCKQAIELIQRIACDSCEVNVLYMHDSNVAKRADSLGIKPLPAVVIDGKVATCCAERGPDEATLRSAGLGGSYPL